jgi:CubicO group peptidase (beta-lactamase class C family)
MPTIYGEVSRTTMRLCAGMLTFCISASAFAAGSGPTPAQIEEDFSTLAARHSQSAIAAARLRDGKVVWTGVAGRQDDAHRASERTLFNIASLAKPITAELALRLVDEGVFALDASMAATWVEPDVQDDPRHRILTPRIALSHQTGFPNWRAQNRRLRFLHDPGSSFGYSGEGYEYLARFIEHGTGKDFEAMVQTRVFDAMAMRETAYTWRPWMEDRIAVPAEGADFPGAAGPARRGAWVASDNVYTTIGDYARFVAGVMTGEGLGAELARERLRPQVATPGCPKPFGGCPRSSAMALGWMVLDFGKRRIAIHEGGDAGASTMAYFDPDRREGVVVFVSGAGGTPLVLDIVETIDPDSAVLAAFRAVLQYEAEKTSSGEARPDASDPASS